MSNGQIPEVSIICDVYMHEDYIQQCLEGILMQKTTFPIEILIHDDASCDGSADIIRKYENSHPDTVKAVYQEENKYSQGIPIDKTYNVGRARGKYIAFCEGDDWWTDSLKLQKQYDYMESHPECSMCYTDFVRFNQSTGTTNNPVTIAKTEISTEDLLTVGNVAGTLTVFTRTELIREYYEVFYPMMPKFPMGDYPMWLWLSSKGAVHHIPEITAFYRVLETSACHFPDFRKTLEFEISAFDIRMYFCKEFKMQYLKSKIRKTKWTQLKLLCKDHNEKKYLLKVRLAAFFDLLLNLV